MLAWLIVGLMLVSKESAPMSDCGLGSLLSLLLLVLLAHFLGLGHSPAVRDDLWPPCHKQECSVCMLHNWGVKLN